MMIILAIELCIRSIAFLFNFTVNFLNSLIYIFSSSLIYIFEYKSITSVAINHIKEPKCLLSFYVEKITNIEATKGNIF